MTQKELDRFNLGICIFDSDLRIKRCNRKFQTLNGLPPSFCEEGAPYENAVRAMAERGDYGAGDIEDLVQRHLLPFTYGNPHVFMEIRSNGVVLEIWTNPLKDGGRVAIYTDVTEQKKAQAAAHSIGKILDQSPNEVFLFDADTLRFSSVNKAGQHNTGYARKELGEMTLLDFMPEITKKILFELIEPLCEGKKKKVDVETFFRRKDGTNYPVEVRFQVSRETEQNVLVASVHDITARKEAEKTIWRQANYDSLTQLPNRAVFFDRLQMAEMSAERDNRMVGVFFVDLDHFKDVNDTHGHTVGDGLLKEVSDRLRKTVRRTDTVARLGGDEFGIIQTSIKHVDDTEVLAAKILESLTMPLDIKDKKIFIGASIGITIYPLDDKGPEDLLRNADIAMYAAKDKGRNTYEHYTADMSSAIKNRNELEQELRAAIDHGDLFLAYQPKVLTGTREIVGVEALLRWNHPDRGAIPPAEFIPLAERSGIIVPLGEWVIREACRQNKTWQDAGLPVVDMAVNLSAVQLRQPDIVETIERILRETGLSPHCLELEITESTAMHDARNTVIILDQLSELGVKISLDDFGTGYSSLAYLKRFPLSRIKIDRSFISDVLNNSDDAAIVSAVITLGQALNMKVTAEGVEETGQINYLKGQGCEEIQGFHFSRPIAPAAFAEMLKLNQKS